MTLLEGRRNNLPLYTYDIEGQALAAATSQANGEFVEHLYYSNYFGATEKYNEAGCDWYVLPTGMVLYANDCDEDLMQEFIHSPTRNLKPIDLYQHLLDSHESLSTRFLFLVIATF